MTASERRRLESVLRSFEVPVDLWGQGKAKTFCDLFNEINQGESSLQIDHRGLNRITKIVKMLIIDPQSVERGYLIEYGQYLPDGRYRERKQHPGGKLKLNETPEKCLVREIEEELEFYPVDYTISLIGDNPYEEERPSISYPGLKCFYLIYKFKIELSTQLLKNLPDPYDVLQIDGTRQIFKWQKSLIEGE